MLNVESIDSWLVLHVKKALLIFTIARQDMFNSPKNEKQNKKIEKRIELNVGCKF